MNHARNNNLLNHNACSHCTALTKNRSQDFCFESNFRTAAVLTKRMFFVLNLNLNPPHVWECTLLLRRITSEISSCIIDFGLRTSQSRSSLRCNWWHYNWRENRLFQPLPFVFGADTIYPRVIAMVQQSG